MIPPAKLGLLALGLADWPLQLEDDSRVSIPRLALSTLTEQADDLFSRRRRSLEAWLSQATLVGSSPKWLVRHISSVIGFSLSLC
jgi:hypothetical protein